MSHRRTLVLTAVIAVVAAGAARAQSVPNLSGTWVLDMSKSDFGPAPAMARTEVIDHQEPKLVIKRTLDGTQATLTYAVDGKRYENSIGGTNAASTLAWDGPVLVMTTEVESPNGPATIVDRFSLSADGKTLTIDRSISVQQGTFGQTLVLSKQ